MVIHFFVNWTCDCGKRPQEMSLSHSQALGWAGLEQPHYFKSATTQMPAFMLQMHELILHFRTIAASIWIAPGHNWSVCDNRSKCALCGLNLLHILELMLDFRAVATERWRAPWNPPTPATQGGARQGREVVQLQQLLQRNYDSHCNSSCSSSSSFRAMVFPRPAAPIFCSVSRFQKRR